MYHTVIRCCIQDKETDGFTLYLYYECTKFLLQDIQGNYLI